MKNDRSRMFAYIETCLYWGDGLTASMLGQVFNLARQNAQQVISAYREQHPSNMIYDASKRRHITKEDFTPHHISNKASAYLDYVRGMSAIAHYWDDMDWNEVIFEDVDKYLHAPQNNRVIQTVLSAIQNEQAISLRYQSKFQNKLQNRLREISPHHLVHASHRYHVRAYCHEFHKYFDFVLTRMSEVFISRTPWVSADGDESWHKPVELSFKINPDLPDLLKTSLRLDYNIDDIDIRRIETTQAKISYIRREMERIDWRYKKSFWIEISPID